MSEWNQSSLDEVPTMGSESQKADETFAMGIALPDGEIPVPDYDETLHEKPENQWLEMWRSLRANRAALVSLIFIVFLVLVAILGPYLTPYNPIETDMSSALQTPSAQHWFGTDQLGMDIFSRVIAGTRVSLTVGLLAVSIALTTGIILGAIAGYAGGWVDTVIMRVMDMMLAIPSILLAITLMAALGKGIDKAVIAIGLVSIPEYARIVRGNILSIKENDYIAAAQRGGALRRSHHLPPRAAQRAVGDHRARHARHLERDPRHRRARLPRPRRSTATARVGRHARPCSRLHLPGAAHAAVSGYGDHRHRARIQPARGRSARCARPPRADQVRAGR